MEGNLNRRRKNRRRKSRGNETLRPRVRKRKRGSPQSFPHKKDREVVIGGVSYRKVRENEHFVGVVRRGKMKLIMTRSLWESLLRRGNGLGKVFHK